MDLKNVFQHEIRKYKSKKWKRNLENLLKIIIYLVFSFLLIFFIWFLTINLF